METKNKFSTWVKNQQVADQRYKQKQREDPEIHQQYRDERWIETKVPDSCKWWAAG